MAFTKAERKKAKLRLALCGPSGSGKTYSALLIAQGLGGRVAMMDTESGSGELYANLCAYDVQQVHAPYEPAKYVAAIKEAEAAGYNVLIIDSLSHAWAGEGGLLDQHDKVAKASRSGNSYTAWREITPLHNRLVDTILQSSLHIIACMRTRTAYEIVDDDKGKKAPKKIGLAPVQRDGMEYEFTAVLDLSVDGHIATSSKDRTGIFDGKYSVPSIDTGKQLVGWLDTGIEVPEKTQEQAKQQPQAAAPQATEQTQPELPSMTEFDHPEESITLDMWDKIKLVCKATKFNPSDVLKNLNVAKAGDIKKGDLLLIEQMLKAA